MKRSQYASLKHLNSFSVEAQADQILELETDEDLQELAAEHCFNPSTDLVLGGGSNILFAGNVEGSVILNRVSGKRIISDSDDDVLVEVCGGENWHQLVLWALDQGLSGIENLSLIPGLAGAAPMQNIGAYGVELSDVLKSVRAIELKTGEVHLFDHDQCQLSYRDSRFKSADANRYLITHVALKLQRQFVPKLTYAGLQEELNSMGIDRPTAKQVSEAVIRIRLRKLPDPAVTANAGSYFKNPVVDQDIAESLRKDFADLPVYPTADNKAKISAAWLIDQCGWKGHREGDAGVSDQHALVLVNYGNASGHHLLELAGAITDSVDKRFGIQLIPEPRIIY
jgi:UDP-N-acetylmuramate dehydrogenase